MKTKDMLEQDNYYRYNTNTLSIPSSPSFLDEVASSKMDLHGGWFRK